MKIIVLGTAWPYRGGLATFNERLAREFLKQGHEVRVVTFKLQYPDFLFPGKTQYSDSPAPEGLDILRRMNSVNPFNWLKVGLELRRLKADLVVIKFWLPFMAPCLGTIARIARRGGRTRVVSILDNIIPHEHRIGDRLFAKYFTGSVDEFVAMSASVLEDVKRFDSRKPKMLLPHPLYDNFGAPLPRGEAAAQLGLDPSYRYILFFGLIRDYKGLDLLLEAFADRRIDKSRFRLLVAGEFYGDGSKYRKLADSLQLGDSVVWHAEFIPDGKVRLYFSLADLVAQPYKSATQSGVTQIAYHFEKPMLVTGVGGLAEIVPDGKVGYVVEPQAAAIADALVEFCSDSDFGRFAEGIREEKMRYSWEKFCIFAENGQK